MKSGGEKMTVLPNLENAVLPEMFQKVRLKNGTTAHIVEIFNNGEAYMVDVKLSNGNLAAVPPVYPEYETITISPQDITSIIVETDMPFATA